MNASTIKRRTLIHAGLAGAVLGTTAVVPALAKPGGGGAGGNALQIPPLLTSDTLRAGRSSVNLGGRTGSALTYNGLFPGPTIVTDTGATRTIRVYNDLDQDTTVHWHGLVVPPAVDGQPHDAFGPGDYLDYALPVRQRAGLNFYHPHPHLLTATQVALGLQGAFIVRDAEETALGLPADAYEVPLVIRDANVDRSGRLTYNGRASGFLGSVPLVNGTLDPYLTVDNGFYRLRAVNAANSRVFRLAFSDGRAMTLIGTDGGLLPSAVDLTEITFGNAERLDLLVDLRGLAGEVSLVDLDSGWTLLRLRPSGRPGGPFAGLSTPTLSTVTPLANPVRTRTFSFDGMTSINGVRYDMNTSSFSVPRSQVEKWTFIANGNPPHPVHIHGASFQLLERRGGRGRLFAWERGWKDTFLLLDKESVDILIRFDLEGRYLMHCHKLEHEDAGMMLNFTVTSFSAQGSAETGTDAPDRPSGMGMSDGPAGMGMSDGPAGMGMSDGPASMGMSDGPAGMGMSDGHVGMHGSGGHTAMGPGVAGHAGHTGMAPGAMHGMMGDSLNG